MGLQAAYRSYQFEPRAHGSLGVVFVGLGIPEVDQDPIAHVLRDEASEALHSFGYAFLVGRNHFAEVFRVHACRQRR
jgi:hypothetical protein